MRERYLEATVGFLMKIRKGETYEEARDRFIDSVLSQTINLADHDVHWSLDHCEEQ